ncbi:hypothetical protein CHLRE_09g406625v5 [Chlamydomonas reinhardtii]|uniref:EGF-like domain-containing protein n=1 Tax=Chlamydomonas reinhardtii TaxID=3055 RepID=A0A2K3DFA6_CHLRE|nr:uncharacterized protein CHLRE_09g406625v5 [Chlamydomonas reinhardtii]PNW79220.1 hypothetical protein CHLRE_09g406625v5 [Chlamydomonas reinhardtii]
MARAPRCGPVIASLLIFWAFTITPSVSAGRSLFAAGGQQAAAPSACAQLQGGSDPCFPGKCQGKSSSEFSCTCPSGYKLAASNKKCDADPCASVDWESVDACVFANAQLSVTCKSGFNSYNSNSKKCRGLHEYDTNRKSWMVAASSPPPPPPPPSFILSFRAAGSSTLCMTANSTGGNMYSATCSTALSAWQNFMVEDTNTPNQYVIKLAANPTMLLNYSGSLSNNTAKAAISSDVASIRTWTVSSRTPGTITSIGLAGTDRCIAYPTFSVGTCYLLLSQRTYAYAAVV